MHLVKQTVLNLGVGQAQARPQSGVHVPRGQGHASHPFVLSFFSLSLSISLAFFILWPK